MSTNQLTRILKIDGLSTQQRNRFAAVLLADSREIIKSIECLHSEYKLTSWTEFERRSRLKQEIRGSIAQVHELQRLVSLLTGEYDAQDVTAARALRV